MSALVVTCTYKLKGGYQENRGIPLIEGKGTRKQHDWTACAAAANVPQVLQGGCLESMNLGKLAVKYDETCSHPVVCSELVCMLNIYAKKLGQKDIHELPL
eukprot:28605-Pelagomonas_calceolata.AAC.9